MKNALLMLVCSFLVGHLLLIFSWHEFAISRYIYSLGALLVGLFYFRRCRSVGMRSAFIALAVVFWLLLTAVYVAIGKIPLLNLEPPGLKMM